MLWAGLLGKVHQLVGVLADEPLLVVAGNVVPHLVKLVNLPILKNDFRHYINDNHYNSDNNDNDNYNDDDDGVMPRQQTAPSA